MEDQRSPDSSQTEALQAPKRQGKKKTPTSAYIVLSIFLIGSFLTVYAYMNDVWMFSNEFKPGPAITMNVSDITIGQSMVGKAANGTVTNDSGQQYERVQVEVNLYNADGDMVGTATETIELLELDQVWNFSAFIFDDTVVRAELLAVTGYVSDD